MLSHISSKFCPDQLALATLCVLFLLSSCQNHTPSATVQRQSPSATEVFHLRSECATLAQRIFDETDIKEESRFSGLVLHNMHSSHYEPQTNRCYVLVEILDLSNIDKYHERCLYDGQTKEMLASEVWSDGKGKGMVYAEIEHDDPDRYGKYGNDDTRSAYIAGSLISKLMADDHTR